MATKNGNGFRPKKKHLGCESKEYPGRNKHHLLPKSEGGEDTPDNLLLLHVDRHNCWHKLFGQRSLEEVILLLTRIHKAKGRCLYDKLKHLNPPAVSCVAACKRK